MVKKSPEKLRTCWLKIRVNAEELASWKEKAQAASMPLSQLLRQSLTRVTVRNRTEDQQLRFALSRIGININRLAGWASTWKGALETRQLIPYLIDEERKIAALVATREGGGHAD